jgi:hypothetical protein
MSKPFHVLIIGGGIGGLTLAQGLKRARISAAVYERDRTLTDRLQGYRVHISPTGSLALHECLPPHLFEVFDRTCGAPTSAVRFFTEQMRLLLAFDGDLVATTDPVAPTVPPVASHCVTWCWRGSTMCISARPSVATKDTADASPRISRTARALRAMCWLPPTGAGRESAGNFCPMLSASRPAWSASQARSFSTRRAIESRGRSSTGSASSQHAAASDCL